MKKILFLIDPGHGGTYPNEHDRAGQYVTSGKRSPKWDDRTFANGSPYILFEGVNNRDNARRLVQALNDAGMDAIDIVNDWRDISLTDRVNRANQYARTRSCVYISLHSNASGNGVDWASAHGNEIFVAPTASLNSKRFADILEQNFLKNFDGVSKWRGVKNGNFYVLRATNCPAILIEAEFHDNKESAKLMLSEDYKKRLIDTIVNSCYIYKQ
ncbi:N-acetylmuramoyl-L-alanine amidase [Flavobacteriaceae bacterium]|nr:N-acetylmuramoyl-L-alanine amidase [Flavobacteriaceae bacterium]